MSQPRQIVPIEGRRLVLGFDAGCMTCSGLAKKIEEQVGKRVEVLNLRDPKVEQWRKAALGENAPWAPTLVEVKGLRVRAWTGWQMAVQLGRFLGPVSTWRVMQALGEVGAAPRIEASSVVEKLPDRAAEAVVGMSRRQFLKGVGGAAVAMGALSGFGPFTHPAAAIEEWQYPNFERSVRLTGTQLRDYCNRIAQRKSCEWTAGPNYAPAMQSGLSVTSADDGIAQGNGVKARAYEHFTASGNSMYACVFDLQGEKTLVFYEWEHRRNGIKYEVKRWGEGPSGARLWAERMVMNGTAFTDPSAPSLRAASCPEGCASYTSGEHQVTTCSSISIGIGCLGGVAATCGACAAACSPNSLATVVGTRLCYLCLFAGCPAAIANCCATTCTICVNCFVPYT